MGTDNNMAQQRWVAHNKGDNKSRTRTEGAGDRYSAIQ